MTNIKSRMIIITVFLIILSVSCYLPFLNILEHPDFSSFKELAKNLFFSIGYVCLTVLFWKNKFTRVLAFLMIIIWIVNYSITLSIYLLFNTSLDSQLTMTILCSNLNEAKNFIIAYWHLVLILLFIFIIFCLSINSLSKNLKNKTIVIISSILILTVGYKICELTARGKFNEPNFLISEKLSSYITLNNYAVFIRTHEDMKILNNVEDNRPIYNLDIRETDIDTYVLVLGESVRRDHVSLNGYGRLTMPNMQKRIQELFVFEQAISAAPITTMALTSALTIKPVNSDDYLLLADNIINLANQAGYETYWYSLQRPLGQYNTVITSVAKMSDHLEWLDITKHDDVFLPKIDEALNDHSVKKQKKLIVIHTNGSHFVACNQYPESEKYFTGGESAVADCYDDSIRFTDKILEQIFVMLEKKHASVFYFSDHGQVRRMKRGELDYFHGSINPSKESIEVPQFIWYSPILSSQDKKLGSYPYLYSTGSNYYLLANWLGIKAINEQVISSPLSDSYYPENNFIIMDTRSNIFRYENMRSDKNIGIK